MPLESADISLSGVEIARWHIEHPGPLAKAMVLANNAVAHLDSLARLVIPRMPRRILASSTLKTVEASSRVMLLDETMAHEHIGIRTEKFAVAVAVDCDHADWPELLEEITGYGVPRPTWIAADPWTGRAHLVWCLRYAVLLTPCGREGPRHLFEAVRQTLRAALLGDSGFAGTLTENPWRNGRATTRSGAPAIPAVWDAHRTTTSPLRFAVIPAPALHSLRDLRRALHTWQDATEHECQSAGGAQL